MRALLVLALLGTSAYAGNNEVSFGSSIRALPSSSADAITPDSMAGPAFTYARALDLDLPIDGLRLWAQASFEGGMATGTMFQTMQTDVSAVMVTAGAMLRYKVVRNVFANARVAFGGEETVLRLTDPMGNTARDHSFVGVARGSGEVDVMFVDKPRFGIGLRVEFGYLAAGGAGLVPHRTQDDTLKIPLTEASIGHLDLSGPYATIGVMSQF
jgi:hypothetical protein